LIFAAMMVFVTIAMQYVLTAANKDKAIILKETENL